MSEGPPKTERYWISKEGARQLVDRIRQQLQEARRDRWAEERRWLADQPDSIDQFVSNIGEISAYVSGRSETPNRLTHTTSSRLNR